MIANLMMYKRPELEEAHVELWQRIRKQLTFKDIDSPVLLSQNAEEFSVWTNKELILSQTCGLPYRVWLHNQVSLIGTPDYGLEECPRGHYRSAIVVRADDPRNELSDFITGTFAYNQKFSQSGYAAMLDHLSMLDFWFEKELHAKHHIHSAQSVARGDADIASLDAVSWRSMQRYEAFADDLRVLAWTRPTPALPLITAISQNEELIFQAVRLAIKGLPTDLRMLLGIQDLVKIPKEDYLAIPIPLEVQVLERPF
ncbi:MAG: PhnD/SsuA/transferrin family substrate-binding protein [Cohaesibacter sp.]|nr:PhnD/SsuA/transferrin family substrate-binding protein [Cohaesibacter sp.]